MAYGTYKKRTYTKKPQQRLRKRWYFDASIPKTVPFVGGTSLRMGSGNLVKRSITAAVKNAIVNAGPTKHKVVDATTLVFLQHQTTYTWNPLGNIPIGTGETSRLATDIHVKKIKLKFVFANDATQSTLLRNQPLHVRVMWIRSDAQVQGGTDVFGSGLGNSDLFVPGFSLPFNAVIDKDRCTAISDNSYRIPAASVDGTYSVLQFDYDCPLKDFGFKYDGLTSNYSSVNKNLYCIVIPYQVGQTTGVNALQMQFSADVEFCDGR